MPSGYTSIIEKGATFEEFVWTCARAFGALVAMRDESGDAPIPDEFQPSMFYAERIAECTAALHEFENLDKVGLTQRMLAERSAAVDRNIERRRKAVDLHDRYDAMLRRIQLWTPPSDDHRELKQFMVSQVQESIRFDCGDPYQEVLPPDHYLAWRDKRKQELEKSLKRAREEHAGEVERVRRRNEWLRQLRESVPPLVKTPEGKPA